MRGYVGKEAEEGEETANLRAGNIMEFQTRLGRGASFDLAKGNHVYEIATLAISRHSIGCLPEVEINHFSNLRTVFDNTK